MTDSAPGAAAPHLDLDALADVLAGESPPQDDTHLQACASCASRLAELAAAESRVVTVLSTLPPPPVPDGLAERLTAALAAEQPPAPAQVTTLPARRAPRRTWLPAAAAAVALLSAGGLGYALLGTPGGNEEAGDAALSAKAGDDLVLNASGTDYADTEAVDGVLPDVLAGSAGTVQLEDSAARAESGGTAGGASEAAPPAPASGGAPDSADSAAMTADAPAALANDPLGRLRTREGLADCLSALLPPDEPDLRPLALDYASYSGQPALAVVLPDPDPAKLSVFVVGPECSQADDSTLHFFRVDAP